MTTNPFESPQTVAESPEPGDKWPRDIGNFCGRYLQGLALYSVATMLIEWLVFSIERLDLGFLFIFWAGHALRAHSNLARKIVIGFCGLFVVVALGMTIVAAVNGTEGMRIRLFREIRDPTMYHVAVVALVFLVTAGIPLRLLTLSRAKQEFIKPKSRSFNDR